MISRDLAMGIFFLSQTSLGFLGNIALLCCLIVSSFNGIRRRPTDLIVKHLTCANILVLLCKGIPQSMAAFGQTYPLGNISCKLVFYFYRVARGVSLGSTSLLNVFQAITISPSNSKWAQLKVRAPSIISPSLGLCWALCLFANSLIIVRLTDMRDKGNRTELRQFLYCLIVKVNNKLPYYILFYWLSMIGSMVLILFKYKQRVQHIHRSLSNKSLHETKATQRILILLSSFVVFYVASVILMMHFSVQDGGDTWVTHVNVAITACFPALCPFLLIGQYTRNFPPCSMNVYYEHSWYGAVQIMDTEELEKDNGEELPVNTSKAHPKQERAFSLKTLSTGDSAEVLVKISQPIKTLPPAVSTEPSVTLSKGDADKSSSQVPSVLPDTDIPESNLKQNSMPPLQIKMTIMEVLDQMISTAERNSGHITNAAY
ncbi:hypothetical protein U0070_008176, partial [Myodes glareolus]